MKSLKIDIVCNAATIAVAPRLLPWAGEPECLVCAVGQIAGGDCDV